MNWAATYFFSPRAKFKLGPVGAVAVFLVLCLSACGGGRMTQSTQADPGSILPREGTRARQGYSLFLQNCAHCHGEDASGDEGPDLHGVIKSDERIAAMIKNGVKGQMPKFGAKFTDADVQSLIAFVRSLK